METWENWSSVPSGATGDSPAAAVHNGDLHIVVRGLDGASLGHGWVDLGADTFMGWTCISGATPSTPVLTG
jgi:hypothetical protein